MKMYFSIPYNIYQEYYKTSLYRLKWDPEMKMFKSVDEKEHDMDEELMKYKVTFFYCPYIDKDEVKDHKARWCSHKRTWYYIGNENYDFFKKYRVVNIDMI